MEEQGIGGFSVVITLLVQVTELVQIPEMIKHRYIQKASQNNLCWELQQQNSTSTVNHLYSFFLQSSQYIMPWKLLVHKALRKINRSNKWYIFKNLSILFSGQSWRWPKKAQLCFKLSHSFSSFLDFSPYIWNELTQCFIAISHMSIESEYTHTKSIKIQIHKNKELQWSQWMWSKEFFCHKEKEAF